MAPFRQWTSFRARFRTRRRPTPGGHLRPRWRGLLEVALARRFGLATREDRLFLLMVPLTGLAAGGIGLLVTRVIAGLQGLLWGNGENIVAAALTAPRWLVVAAPVAGGLLVGAVVWLGRERVAGHGMSGIIEAVALKGGEIRPKPVLLRALAGIATVGSGGSLGREGPAIRMSAMAASWAGGRLGLPSRRLRVLVACGAGAGMAAIYNTPIGGALFAMEVILGNFALEVFGPLVVSSVIATLVARAFRGEMPIYSALGYRLESGWELLAYALLGVVGALVSIGFVRGLRAAEHLFARLSLVPEPIKPALGLVVVGLLGLELPQVFGNGFETITVALHGGLPLVLLLILPVAKLVASGVSLGSGCAGGLFTPSLFVGALVGGAYGEGIHALFPLHTATYPAYAAVGMAAIAAGTSHAPISAILILFEMTGNYDLILPVMLAAIISSVLARRIWRHSIYTESLHRRGVEVVRGREEMVLAGLGVEDLIRPDPVVLAPGERYKDVVERFLSTRRQRLFVTDSAGRLLGAVSLHDIKGALDAPEALTMVVAHDLMTPVDPVLRRSQRLDEAAAAFARSDFERLPVVDDGEPQLLGVLAKRDLLAVYAQEVLGRPALLATFVAPGRGDAARDYVELPPDFSVRLLPVPSRLVGRSLAEARLPQSAGLHVIEIKRPTPNGDERVIPDAATVLEAGDELILLGPTRALTELAGAAAPAGETGAPQAVDEEDRRR